MEEEDCLALAVRTETFDDKKIQLVGGILGISSSRRSDQGLKYRPIHIVSVDIYRF